jgi:hypothetical protein
MGSGNPFTGVGFDTYGDWYRRSRDTQALILPGPDVTTNAAHNVPFDIMAFGGWPLFISYLSILALSLIAIFRVTLRNRQYDAVFVTLTTAWICYQLQSIISINQIGLAVWGWILTGLLIGYPGVQEYLISTGSPTKTSKKENRKMREPNTVSAGAAVSIVVGVLIATTIALPPFLSDAKMRNALNKSDIDGVKAQASAFPVDTLRVNKAAVALARGDMIQSAREVTQIAILKYPDDFAGWFTLYELTPADDPQRAILKAKLHEIDPLNPEWN